MNDYVIVEYFISESDEFLWGSVQKILELFKGKKRELFNLKTPKQYDDEIQEIVDEISDYVSNSSYNLKYHGIGFHKAYEYPHEKKYSIRLRCYMEDNK